MADRPDRVGPGLAAFEPTGGCERVVIAALRQRAIAIVRVHPSDIVAFRKSRGIKARSDPSDARLILAFAADAPSRRGRIEKAKAALDKAIAIAPASCDLYVRWLVPWFRPEDHVHMLEGLRNAGWQD